MARKPLKPLVRGGGYYPSRKWTPLVYAGGYTTANGGEEPAPPPIEKTIIGNPIHILDALAKPAQALSIALEPIQDLHGYDSPWPAGGNVNKWPRQSVTMPQYNNHLYEADYPDIWAAMRGLFAGEQYRTNASAEFQIMVQYADSTSVTIRKTSQTGSISTEEITNIYLYVGENVTGERTVTDMILAKTTTSYPTYSPYSNICPISGHTSADVTRTGKNLFPYENIQEYTYAWYSGSKALADATQPVFVKGGMKYVLSWTPVDPNRVPYVMIRAWHADGNILNNSAETLNAQLTGAQTLFVWQATPQYYQPVFGASSPSCTIQPTEDLWLDICTQAARGAGLNPQLEISDATPTDYSPYVGTTYPIPLGQTIYGGYVDVVTGEVWATWTKISFKPDFISTWFDADASRSTIGCYLNDSDFNSRYPAPQDGTVIFEEYKKAEAYGNDNPWTANLLFINGTLNRFDFRLPKDQLDPFSTYPESQQAVRSFLNDNPIAMCYTLATPVLVTTLTPTQIELLLGENNLFSDGEMTLTYLADGNASDEEALNILLGGRYVNNHGEDEPTDREALDILLGGTR